LIRRFFAQRKADGFFCHGKSPLYSLPEEL